MQIIIDIPKLYYEYCKNLRDAVEINLAIKNGLPLPHKHGKLIDADVLDKTLSELGECMDFDYGTISNILEDAQSIVPATK